MKMHTDNVKIYVIVFVAVLGCALYYFVVFFNKQNMQICPKSGSLSTEENIRLMRNSLALTARISPTQDVEGQVIFKAGISIDNFIKLANKHHIHIKDKPGALGGSSIQILSSSYDGKSSSVQGLNLTPEYFVHESFLKTVNESFSYEQPTSTAISVINFTANAEAGEFMKLWQENEDSVRAIGVGCTKVFYIVGPSDPIKFGGQGIMR